jgi:GTP-binding protein EngB required for normal cell division
MSALESLRRISEIAAALDAESIRVDADVTAARLFEGRFYVACIGQFKRGKSTLVNALIGESILPVGVAPVTSVLTVVRYGARPQATVRFETGGSVIIDVGRIADYVTESANPDNSKRVTMVEVLVPAAGLASGMCLVDTPGVGSVFEANARTTRAFVPQIDAALVVFGADPPLTGDELGLIADARNETSRFVFVLNKADRVTNDECLESIAFARNHVADRLGIDTGPVICVSSTQALRGHDTAHDWTLLLHRLQQLAGEVASYDRERISTRACGRIGNQLGVLIAERIYSLREPLDAGLERMKQLERAGERIAGLLEDIAPLLSASERTLTIYFADAHHSYTAAVVGEGKQLLQSRLAAIRSEPHFREKAFEAAEALARQFVSEWLRSAEPEALKLLRDAVSRVTTAASEAFMHLVSALEAEPISFAADDVMAKLQGRSAFYFTSLMRLMDRHPLSDAFHKVTGRGYESTCQDAETYFVRLLDTNASRAAADIIDRLHVTREYLERMMRNRLSELTGDARTAVDRARQIQQQGDAAVRDELTRLYALATEISELRRPL